MATGFGQGIANALDMFNTMKGREMQNRQLALYEAEEARTAETYKANQEYKLLQAENYVDPEKPYNINYDTVVEKIQGKDTLFDKKLTEYMQQGDNPLIDPNTEILDIEPIQVLDASGKPTGQIKKDASGKPLLGVRVKNSDGTQGVITENGTREPNDNVIEFTAEKIAGLMDTKYRQNVLAKQDMYNLTVGSVGRNIKNIIDSRDELATAQRLDAEKNAGRLDKRFDLKKAKTLDDEIKVTEVADSLGGQNRAAGRALLSTISPENIDDRDEIIKQVAPEVGVVPGETSEPTEEGKVEGDTTSVSEEIQAKEAELAEIKGQKARSAEARELRREIAQLKQQEKGERPKEETKASTDEDIDTQIADLKQRSDKMRPGRAKASLERRMKALGRQRPSEIIETAPPAVQENTEKIVDVVNSATSIDEVADAINNENLVQPETASHVAEFLKSKGVSSIEEFERLQRKDYTSAIVAIAASMPDPSLQSEWLKRLSNVYETGAASIDTGDLSTIQVNQGNLALRGKEYQMKYGKWLKELAGKRAKWGQDASSVVAKVFKDDGEGNYTFNAGEAVNIVNTQEFQNAAKRLRVIDPNDMSKEDVAVQESVQKMMSIYMAGRSQKNEEFWRVFGAWREDAGDVVTAHDIDLKRVRKLGDKYVYTTPDGRRTDAAVTKAQVVQAVGEDAFKWFDLAARSNG